MPIIRVGRPTRMMIFAEFEDDSLRTMYQPNEQERRNAQERQPNQHRQTDEHEERSDRRLCFLLGEDGGRSYLRCCRERRQRHWRQGWRCVRGRCGCWGCRRQSDQESGVRGFDARCKGSSQCGGGSGICHFLDRRVCRRWDSLLLWLCRTHDNGQRGGYRTAWAAASELVGCILQRRHQHTTLSSDGYSLTKCL